MSCTVSTRSSLWLAGRMATLGQPAYLKDVVAVADHRHHPHLSPPHLRILDACSCTIDRLDCSQPSDILMRMSAHPVFAALHHGPTDASCAATSIETVLPDPPITLSPI